MNKKIEDTNEKIYNAFSEVLLLKDYNDVRIQDVLDKSGVARSTFTRTTNERRFIEIGLHDDIFARVFARFERGKKPRLFPLVDF